MATIHDNQGNAFGRDNPIGVTSVAQVIRDGFESINLNNWDIVVGDGDLVELGGNTAGSGYLKISKAVDKEDTETVLLSKFVVTAPLRFALGMSLSQRLAHQRCSVDFVAVDDYGEVVATVPVTPLLPIASASQSTTTLTVNTVDPHGYVPGDRVAIGGFNDSRFNYGEAYIATTPSPTQFTITSTPFATIPSLTASPAPATGFVTKADPHNFANNGLGVFWEGTSASNAKMISRSSGGSLFNTADTSMGSNHTNATVANSNAFADAFNPAFMYDIRYRSEGVIVRTMAMDSFAGQSATMKRSQVIPEISYGYKIRIKAQNNKFNTRVVAKVASAVKTASTTATITTAEPHGLSTGDYIQIYGIRDQTNFANLTTATAVASVIDPNTFTIAFGASATATAYGGVVIRVNGTYTMAPSAQVVQSIQRTGNQMTVIGNTTWAGFSHGDTIQLTGLFDTAGVPLTEYEGAYKVLSISTSTLILASPGDDFALINAGGSVIKRTDLRIHLLRVMDYSRTIVDIDGGNGNTSDLQEAIPVNIAGGTVTAGSTSGVAAHDAAISGNPVRVAGRAVTSNYTGVSSGDVADFITTTVGAQVIKAYSIPELDWAYAAAAGGIITNSDVALRAAGASGIRNYVTNVQLQNVHASVNTEVVIKDGASTVLWRGFLPAGMTNPIDVTFTTPLRGTAATALNVQCVTTGAQVYVNAQGYQAP